MSTVEKQQSSPEATEHVSVDGNQNQVERSSSGSSGGSPSLDEGGNIDKIREILFGVQMRDNEKRFSRIEERLLKESAELREDTRKRFEALEAFVQNEFEALSDRLKSEHQSRDESVQALARDLQETGKALERKLAQFDEQTTRSQRDLRQQILDQSRNLSDEIRQKYSELQSLLEREVADLGHAKTDRASLAALFTEVSLRLNNEFKIPGGE
jgi:DNA repair exonuclease SbcCD ATPase subunit